MFLSNLKYLSLFINSDFVQHGMKEDTKIHYYASFDTTISVCRLKIKYKYSPGAAEMETVGREPEGSVLNVMKCQLLGQL